MNFNCDFHIHSNNSDGVENINSIISIIKNSHINYVTLTDHDTINGCFDFIKLCNENNIYSKTSIEISCFHNGESIHLLTYFIDDSYNDTNFKNLLNKIKDQRVSRIIKMISLLKKHFNINLDTTFINKNNCLTRLELAREITKQGFNLNFEQMLSNKSICYIPSVNLEFLDIVSLLNKLNCIKILAHPIFIKNTNLSFFLKYIDGLEVFHPSSNKNFSKNLIDICLIQNKLLTVGSDFHSFETSKKHGEIGKTQFKHELVLPFIETLFK